MGPRDIVTIPERQILFDFDRNITKRSLSHPFISLAYQHRPSSSQKKALEDGGDRAVSVGGEDVRINASDFERRAEQRRLIKQNRPAGSAFWEPGITEVVPSACKNCNHDHQRYPYQQTGDETGNKRRPMDPDASTQKITIGSKKSVRLNQRHIYLSNGYCQDKFDDFARDEHVNIKE